MDCAAFSFDGFCWHCLGMTSFVTNVVPLLASLIDQRKIVHATCSHFIISIYFFLWCCGLTRAMASSFLRFLDHTQPRATVGRTLLDE